jgi:NADPH:quinone reductase-like Zn-dependent oxidoreductase
MRAAVYRKYGPPEVVRIEEVAKPTPRDDEVLVRTHATTVSSGDWRVRSLTVPRGFGLMARLALGVTKPRQTILGTELAGEVEAIGKDVTKLAVGDAVFAFAGVRMGCHAEYKCFAEDAGIARKPANLSYEEAATLCFGGATALHYLRQAKLERGERVLVNGASGAVGTAAVQLAKHFGAEVTGVCSTANADLVRSLGADHVIDYKREDFTRNGILYDVIVDTAGTASYSRSKASLTKRGRQLQILGGLSDLLLIPWVSLTSTRRLVGGPAPERAEYVHFLADLAAAGSYKPVIDRVYPFDQIVEAHRHVDLGHKKGSVVVTMAAR